MHWITVAAFCVGRARRVFDLALAYVASREQFGQANGKFQGEGFHLADMVTGIDAADLLTLAAADRLDRGLPANREIASAKLYASEMLARVTDAAIQIHGGMGLMDDLPLEVSGAIRGSSGSGKRPARSSVTSSAANFCDRLGHKNVDASGGDIFKQKKPE